MESELWEWNMEYETSFTRVWEEDFVFATYHIWKYISNISKHSFVSGKEIFNVIYGITNMRAKCGIWHAFYKMWNFMFVMHHREMIEYIPTSF